MRNKRIMVVGAKGCGKTSLVNYINDYTGPLKRTQDTIYTGLTIDVPSAFVENAWMYQHVIALSQDACCVLIMVDQSRPVEIYSHGFAKALYCPSFGVISKCDQKPENRYRCEEQLRMIGVKEPFYAISLTEGIGVDILKKRLIGFKEGRGSNL
ncbi:EutP/PduV family microcompartment system protein [Hornefia butyriciproducens]|uniref:EutP/PduV family microcompartment system protein n=1 Tax=Hornefia butyriciproducens TaxID=2652293 RepID=UPI002A911859|nr:EutP/PduV family microcompartment system protein [Hornefia butyriciproducens]MDY6211440.1 EutP/PduV family microcompartment system protein [Hornefia butyriciproducens]